MAIDTAAKRMSAASLSPIGVGILTPDGTISAADRRAVSGVWRSARAAPTPPTASTIEEALYATIIADPTVNSIVDTKVYPLRIPQSTAVPAIIYEQISGWREHTMTNRITMASPVFRITASATTYSGCRALANAIRTALNTASGTEGDITVQIMFLLNETDTVIQPSDVRGLRRYECQQDYKIFFNEILN